MGGCTIEEHDRARDAVGRAAGELLRATAVAGDGDLRGVDARARHRRAGGGAQAVNLQQFDAAVRHSVAGFNFIYADDAGHIAYWHTGTIPMRARGHDPRLPAPGDGRFDWRGYLSPKLWPSVIDPAQGW